jgi:hypothetical protein
MLLHTVTVCSWVQFCECRLRFNAGRREGRGRLTRFWSRSHRVKGLSRRGNANELLHRLHRRRESSWLHVKVSETIEKYLGRVVASTESGCEDSRKAAQGGGFVQSSGNGEWLWLVACSCCFREEGEKERKRKKRKGLAGQGVGLRGKYLMA